jgi:hypothetical protein
VRPLDSANMLDREPPGASSDGTVEASPPKPSPAASHRRRAKWLAGLIVVGLLALVLVRTVLAPPSGQLYFMGDFESRDFSQWSEVQAFARDRYSIVSSPRKQGSFAGRFESVAGECIPMDCSGPVPRGRTEALIKGSGHRVSEGQDRWYRWYTLFPAKGPRPEFTFTQWRADDEQSGPRARNGIYGLMTVGRSDSSPTERLSFQRNGDRWTGALRRGRWIKFVVHIKYSADPNVGLYELWVDGERVMSFHDQSKPANTGVYLKQGVYRNGDTPGAVVYHDGLRIASTRALADLGWADQMLGRDKP